MFSPFLYRRISLLVLIASLLSGFLFAVNRPISVWASSGPVNRDTPGEPGEPARPNEPASKIFIPTNLNGYPWLSPFAIETYATLLPESEITGHVKDLKAGWVRLGIRISWRNLQPNYGDPIHWEQLASFENELRTLQQAGVTPVVVIYDSPHWAVDANARSDGKLTSCAPVRADMFDEFAAFVGSLVNRYKTPEFNVHNWELGNEPDVDPDSVDVDNGFGCWGDEKDLLYFGGKQYGEMLKAVTPAIRAEDPAAQVWLGGLLLAAPRQESALTAKQPFAPSEYEMRGIEADYSSEVRPESFFKGVLEAGAAPFFDLLAYHWYPSYYPLKVDFDLKSGQGWDALGGGVTGKANYLRQLMKDYGVDKPLFINETGLGCIYDSPDHFPWCASPDQLYYQAQSDFLVRTFVRAFGQGVMGVSWYTLENNGWRDLGLLDSSLQPRPSYRAYQQLSSQLQDKYFIGSVNYGSGIEAYAFRKGARQVQVLWARGDETLSVRVPQARFVDAHALDGTSLAPISLGSEIQVTVGFSPIYLTLTP
jgi:hypothetical protein